MKKPLILLATALLLAPFASARTATTAATATPVTLTKVAAKTVHINSANTKTLLTLPGIGPKIAAEIIKNRPYKDAKDLAAKVKGLGDTNIQKILPLIDFK